LAAAAANEAWLLLDILVLECFACAVHVGGMKERERERER
jgi:hypothetical protein